MSKRARKRKLEGDNDAEIKKYSEIMSEEFQEEMATMWEIPQIFHFLHVSREVLHFPHLSMYEMERMLVMPRASKQLASIMTCLLSPPMPKAKMCKIPPMPYNFWVNVLTHKVKGWFKVYQSKHQDVVKVLEAIGVEPEFWRVFHDVSVIDEKDFNQMSFKERVWILKTLCDTIMHSRKTVHEEVMKQCTDEQFEVVLGSDRYGAKYFWFPLFLNNDLRVYRHCIDNTILSTVKPPLSKEGQTPVPKPDKVGRNKRKRSRWKNGALPRDRRRSKKMQDDEEIVDGGIALGSLVYEDTNFSGTSGCSNNNNIAIEATEGARSPSPSKTSSEEAGVSVATPCSNIKSSGYDTNTSSDAKSINETETDDMFRGFDNENDSDVICSIKEILDGLTSTVSDMMDNEENLSIKSTITSAMSEHDEDSRSQMLDKKNYDSESGSDDLEWSNTYSLRKSRVLDDDELRRDVRLFAGMLDDLSSSSFELVADSLDSLRDLANSLRSNEGSEGRTRSSRAPRCEITLATTIDELVVSLQDVEPTLKESVKKARTKLQREWSNCKYGVEEDQDASGNGDHGSNRWILGSQGCPLPPDDDAALSDSAVSQSGNGTTTEQPSSVESNDPVGDKSESSETKRSEKSIKEEERSDEIKNEKAESDENSNSENSKGESEQENRRVLRRRGISSYTEQYSSDDEDADELEEWPCPEAIDSTPGTSDCPSAANAAQKAGQLGDDSDEEDSDQDWILPSTRKRKNKRSPLNRKLKTFQHILQGATGELQDSILSPGALAVSANPELSNRRKETTKDSGNNAGPLICKTESVHSELDIKDEGPIFDYTRSAAQPVNVNHSHIIQPRNRLAGPSNSYTIVRPPAPPFVVNHTPAQPGYYVQRPPNYYPPVTNPRYVQYSYPPMGRGTSRYPYPPGAPSYRPPQNYMQYPNYPPMPPRGPYSGNGAQPQRNLMNHQRHQVPSTTLYGARTATKVPPNRMPVPRPIGVQNNAVYAPYRGTVRPRGAMNNQPHARCYPPRANATQAPPGIRMPRLTAPKQQNVKPTAKSAPKTTSLILLSDSDDEIEMIVPDKQIAAASLAQKRKVVPEKRNQQAPVVGPKPRAKPIVTSEITVPKSREVLSPQMIQRMSQGGISITPVKPQQSKQIAADTSAGTKLVVVVNETGSHYALALPNGSKLILTPDQVAQIRASNGGKLVL